MTDIGELFIALKVDDAQTSGAFYQKLGFTPEDEGRWSRDYARFDYRGTKIALMISMEHGRAQGCYSAGCNSFARRW